MTALRAPCFVGRYEWLKDESHRLDATAFATGALAVRDRISQGPWERKSLLEVAALYYGPRFPRRYVGDPRRGVKFLSSSDILLADFEAVPLLSTVATPVLDGLMIGEGWTLISRSGTVGNTAYVRGEMVGMAASEHVMRAVPRDGGVRAGYLFAYLTSRLGQVLLKQRTYGSVVQHIEPHHIADIPVPIPDQTFQDRIHRLVQGAADARSKANQLLDQASNYFDALVGSVRGLHEHAFAAGTVRRAQLSSRLDAFYHVGWAAQHMVEGDMVRTFADVTIPGRAKLVHAERGVPFLTGVDVYQVRPVATKRLARHMTGLSELMVSPGTVLLQVDGQRYGLLGRPAYAGRRLEGAAVSWHLARFRSSQGPRLLAFARSDVGRRSIVRNSFGTSVPSIAAFQLAQLRVPELPTVLEADARCGLALREQADTNEELAIREVEAWLS